MHRSELSELRGTGRWQRCAGVSQRTDGDEAEEACQPPKNLAAAQEHPRLPPPGDEAYAQQCVALQALPTFGPAVYGVLCHQKLVLSLRGLAKHCGQKPLTQSFSSGTPSLRQSLHLKAV